MAYVANFKGYVADVPEVWFKRIDGKVFHYNKITQASATPQVNFTEVNAGWGLYPVAYLPAASSLEISLTSGQFDSSLFALANGGDFTEEASYETIETATVNVASNTATISVESAVKPDITKVVVNGLTTVTSTPNAGQVKVEVTGSQSPWTIMLTFNADSKFTDGDPVDVNYVVSHSSVKVLKVSNDRAAIGEAYLKWPVYNGGENVSADSFTGASVMGHIYMHIFRCRCTQMPGFDTSYKSAATNAVTFATMDPENSNSDGNAYEISFIPKKD